MNAELWVSNWKNTENLLEIDGIVYQQQWAQRDSIYCRVLRRTDMFRWVKVAF